MPYPPEHKQRTRERILDSARAVFNRKGFAEASIDEIMQRAGLTRGGFYHHFRYKDELFVETIRARGACNPAERWQDVELDFQGDPAKVARQLVKAYLSREHLADRDYHCPLAALPSDVAHSGTAVRRAYRQLLANMAKLIGDGMDSRVGADPDRALAITALCVGALLVGRTVPDRAFAQRVVDAARSLALEQMEDVSP